MNLIPSRISSIDKESIQVVYRVCIINVSSPHSKVLHQYFLPYVSKYAIRRLRGASRINHHASTTQLLQEFKSPRGIILLPDIYLDAVDIYASGNQSTSRAQIAVQLLLNNSIIFASPFARYTNTPGSLWFDAYLPGMKETDRIIL
jgi:hypothetical protein